MSRPRKQPRAPVDTSALVATIDRFLEEENITQAELARRADISDAPLSKLLTSPDYSHMPSNDTLVGLARAMRMPVVSVLALAGVDLGAGGEMSDALERVMHILEVRPDLLEHMIFLSKKPIGFQRNMIELSEAMAARSNGHRPSPHQSPE